jgi:hypothetical protein
MQAVRPRLSFVYERSVATVHSNKRWKRPKPRRTLALPRPGRRLVRDGPVVEVQVKDGRPCMVEADM